MTERVKKSREAVKGKRQKEKERFFTFAFFLLTLE
jgi:hypothetical protein